LHAALGAHSVFSMPDAQAAGRLMMERTWHYAIRDLAARYGRLRPDMKPALAICANELTWWERWSYGVQSLSPEEKWRAFIDEAAKLYPAGPDHDQLWSHAGGDNSKLPHGQSGS
jgi:hypothetical protein